MLNKTICTVSFVALLAGCDSGGGKSTTSTTSGDIRTGSFIDSPVEGLSYKTKSQSGTTDENGQFKYKDGESIEFRVGDIYLGTAPAQEVITPFNLLGSSPLTQELIITNSLQSNEVTSFDRAINIATLLQALDTDGNPDNGIDLGEAHSKLRNSNIDFYAKADQFEKKQDFQDTLEKLDIDSHPTYIQAAQHLYDSLEIKVESKLVDSLLTVENSKKKNSISYTHNEEDLLTKKETDFGNDGIIDQIVTYDYDSSGRLVRSSDSASKSVESISYDSFGNILTKEIDFPADAQDSFQTYTYQGSNLMKLETDLGNDGSIDITADYLYNNNGDVVQYTVSRSGETESTSTTRYTYIGGNISTLSEDSNGDGETDSAINYNYDANGNMLSLSTTRFIEDQRITTINNFNYNESNLPVRYESDNNQDGTPDYIEEYAYNNLGKRTEYKKDNDGDGNWDFVAQYSYDIYGNRTQMIEDGDGNGVVDKIWQAEYQPAILENPWDVIGKNLSINM